MFSRRTLAPRDLAISAAFFFLFILTLYLAGAPLLLLLVSTFNASTDSLPLERLSFGVANYIQVFGDRDLLGLLENTAVFTAGSVVIGIGGAVVFAWLIERSDIPCRHLLFGAILVPMVVPNMIYAMAWIQLLNPNNGLLNVILENVGLGFIRLNVYSIGAMVFVQGVILASHAYLLIAAPFRMIDPTWEEQSEISGKSIVQTIRLITLPVLKPALLALVAFFTVSSMETFDIPGTIGLPAQIHVFSTRIYWATHPDAGRIPDYGMASTLALVLVVVASILIYFYRRQTRNARQFVTITGRAYRSKRTSLGRWRWPIFMSMAAVVLVTIALPILMLIWRSLIPFYVPPSLKNLGLVRLTGYQTFSENGVFSAMGNTAVVALVTGLGTGLLAALIAWFTLRSPVASKWRGYLSTISFIPQAIPSVVIGLCVMFVYLTVPIPIYGTIWIIVIALITKYLAYSTASMMAAQLQISPELEEASFVCGASWFKTYYRVAAPLLAPAFSSCFLWVCINAVRELGVSVMLYGQRSQVLSTKVWNLWEGGYVAQASAIGVATIVLLVLLLSLPRVFARLRHAARHLLGSAVTHPRLTSAANDRTMP
jgi:iron(III) transport system permease protein